MLKILVPVIVATIGLIGAVSAAVFSRRQDRQQQARSILLAPAEHYARVALSALALLRYVTPPEPPVQGASPHRNESLLRDKQERESRLQACREAIDEVRIARADVRLVFHPKSWASEFSRRTLSHLREALESAEEYYRQLTQSTPGSDWRKSAVTVSHRQHYYRSRDLAYKYLDAFFEDVAERLIRPSWDAANIEAAWSPGHEDATIGNHAKLHRSD